MKSSSLRLLKEANIQSPSEYRDSLIHAWALKEAYRKNLSIYLLRETTPEKFFFHMKDGELRIQGKLYSITWINSPKEVRECSIIVVSLRYCRILDRGYALVQTLKEGQFDALEY